jgi:hypothetical protein
MTVDDRTEEIAVQVARYLRVHPDASDTVDGIARWWLARQRFDDAREMVLAALERLVERGLVERRTLANGVTLFRGAQPPGRS